MAIKSLHIPATFCLIGERMHPVFAQALLDRKTEFAMKWTSHVRHSVIVKGSSGATPDRRPDC